MKKFYLILLTSIFALNIYGQLNPIRNLEYWHGYDVPNNCFRINWDEPDPSTIDTLIGYNIYKKDISTNDSLYMFSNSTYKYCDNCSLGVIDSNFCDLMYSGDLSSTFEVFVTAVYNSDSIESDTDTIIFDYGMVIKIDELLDNSFEITPNPNIGSFRIKLNDNTLLNTRIEIFNINGILIKQLLIRDVVTLIDLSTEQKGAYFIKIYSENKIINRKVIIK